MNKLTNAAKFIEIWDGLTAVSSTVTKNEYFKKSELKNINYMGDCHSDAAVILTKNDNIFYDAIEDGIKTLVMILVKECNWITFSSCAGHVSFGDEAYKKRMVQLLPRNEAQFKEIKRTLSSVAYKTNAEIAATGNLIRVILCEEKLLSDENDFNSIKIIFNSQALNEQAYFSKIEAATEMFCKNLLFSVKGSHD